MSPNIPSLPSELIALIIDHVNYSEPLRSSARRKMLLSTSLVSHAWRSPSQEALNKDVELDMTVERWWKWAKRPGGRTRTRMLRLTGLGQAKDYVVRWVIEAAGEGLEELELEGGEQGKESLLLFSIINLGAALTGGLKKLKLLDVKLFAPPVPASISRLTPASLLTHLSLTLASNDTNFAIAFVPYLHILRHLQKLELSTSFAENILHGYLRPPPLSTMIAIGALAPPPPTPPPSSSFSDFRTLTFLALDSFTFDLFDFPAFMSALHSLTTLFIELYHPVPAAFLPSIAALPSGSLKHVGTKVYGSDSVYGSLCQVLEEAALARVDKWTLFDRVEEARGGDAYEEFVRRCRDKKLELQWKMWDNEVSAWGQGT